MTLRDLRNRAESAVFRLMVGALQMLNLRQTIRLAELLAWLMINVLPRRKTRYEVAYENIRCSFGDELGAGEIHEMIRRMWVHLFRMVAEIVQFPRKLTLENCRDVIVFRNRSAAVSAMCTGRPVLVLGGHFGNWEASLSTFGVFGFPMGVVARQLDNPYLHEWFCEQRQRFGHLPILKRGGWEDMLDMLEKGGNIGLLGDQDAGRRGLFVDFFGRPASTFKSIALMAMEYKALIVVGYGLRLPDDFEQARWARFEIGCEEVIDAAAVDADDPVQEITRRYTAALERAIRRAPEQYFWVHRRWKTAPRRRKQSVPEAA